jgi:hypothetical protein
LEVSFQNMKASAELHQLIRSMSMSEKRYFKIHSSRHVIGGDANNYMQLFDAIDKQDAYDEEEVKRSFGGRTFIKHLPSEKHYLYHQVLDSLNSFNRDKTFLSRYANILVSIEILYNRGLFTQCKKLIDKAKKEAYSLERFSMLLLILRWETLIYIKDEDDKNLNRSLSEELRILEVIRVQSVLMKIAFNIQVQIDKGNLPPGFIRNNENELERSLPAGPETDSFWAKYYYHSAVALLASLQNKPTRLYKAYKEIKTLMDGSPQFIKDLPGIYHLNSNNLVNVMFLLEKYNEAEMLISQQRRFTHEHGIKRPALSRMVFINTCDNELFLYYKTGRYIEGAAMMKQIEAEVKKIELTFSPSLFDLLFIMAVTELVNGNYKGATKWLNKILNAERVTNFRKELQVNARMLYLVALFESNDVLLENRLNSTRRFLAQEKQFKTQLKMLDIIRLMTEDPSGKKNRSALEKYAVEVRRESRRAKKSSLNKQFDFAGWISDKLSSY